MQSTGKKKEYALNHISIDSVILGFDGRELRVLLTPQEITLNGKLIANSLESEKGVYFMNMVV